MSLITSFLAKSGSKTSEVFTEEVRESVPNLTAREASEVKTSLRECESRKRGKYMKWKADEKRYIGEYAVKHGPARTVRDLQKKYPGLTKQSVNL